MKKIRGTMETVKPIEVLIDKVYIRKNIIRIDESDGENDFHGWEYEETEIPLELYLSGTEVMGRQITSIMLEVL